MTTPLIPKDSQPHKQDAATQQIAPEFRVVGSEIFDHKGVSLYRFGTRSIAHEICKALNEIILSAIERATIHRCPDCGSWITRPAYAAHNAELAAEREERAIIERSRDAWKSQVAGLTEALAAERQRLKSTDILVEQFKAMANTERQCRDQAEEQLRNLTEAHIIQKKIDDDKLLSALAAIDRLVKMYVANLGTEHEFICCIGSSHASDMTKSERKNDELWSAWDAARKVDLSALHEHDVKVLDRERDRLANSEWHKGWAAAIEAGESNKERLIAEVREPLVNGLNRLMALLDVKCLPQARLVYEAALAKVKEQ